MISEMVGKWRRMEKGTITFTGAPGIKEWIQC